MTNIRVIVPTELLDRAHGLGIDVAAVMVAALEQHVASIRIAPVTTTVTPDDEDAGPFATTTVHSGLGFPEALS